MDRHQQQKAIPTLIDDSSRLSQLSIPTSSADGTLPSLAATPGMRAAKARLEEETGELIVDDELLASHGWLSPEGQLYPCGFKRHDCLAGRLGFSHASAIEERGYIKLANLRWLVERRYRTNELTDAQWSTIEAWYEKNGFPKEHYLKLFTMVG